MTLIRRTLAGAVPLVLAAGWGEPRGSIPDYPDPALHPASISAAPGDTVRLRITDAQGRPVRATTLTVTGAVASVDSAALVTATARAYASGPTTDAAVDRQ